MDRHILYYLAGIIDGEGYLGILKNKNKIDRRYAYYYATAVKVASVDKTMCLTLQKEFGGYISERNHPQPNHKNSFCWEIKNDKQVLEFLDKIQDKLMIKDKQAVVLRSFIDYRRTLRSQMSQGYQIESYKKFDDFYLKIRELNFRGIRPAETK